MLDLGLVVYLARKAQPFFEIVEGAADFAFTAIGCKGDATDALVEEMALEADVDEFFTQTQGAFEQSDDQGMGEAFGEHSDAAADRAGIGADEVGDLAEGVAAGDGEVEEVLIRLGKFMEAVEDVGARLFWILLARAAVGRAAEIEDELKITTGHLTPLSGGFGPRDNVRVIDSTPMAGPPSPAGRYGGRAGSIIGIC